MNFIIMVMSLMGSVMLAFYWLLRPVSEKFFSVGWKYTVLKISLLLFAVPFPALKGFILRGMELFNAAVPMKYLPPMDLYLSQSVVITSDVLVPLEIRRSALIVIMIMWLIGFCVVLVWQVYCYFKIKSLMLRQAKSISQTNIIEMMDCMKRKVGVRRKVSVFVSPDVHSPVTMGLLSAIIILPEIEFMDEKLGYILEHELIHIKHKDFIIRLFAVYVQAVHWFNPCAYLLLREIGVVSEYACDERVVLSLNERQRTAYGHTILDLSARSILEKETGRTLINSFANYNKRAMKARLGNMKSIKRTKVGMRVISVLMGLAMTMISMTTVFAYDETSLIEGDSIETKSSEMVTAKFITQNGNSQVSTDSDKAGTTIVSGHFLSSKGDFHKITENMLNNNRSLCYHDYEDGQYIRHTLYTDGRCKEEYFNAKFCGYCNRIVVGTKINTLSYAVCIH